MKLESAPKPWRVITSDEDRNPDAFEVRDANGDILFSGKEYQQRGDESFDCILHAINAVNNILV